MATSEERIQANTVIWTQMHTTKGSVLLCTVGLNQQTNF